MFPTETPTPNLTVVPTQTPLPTPTPEPTVTPTLEPTDQPLIVSTGPIATAKTPLRLGRQESVPEAGFSFKAPVNYTTSYSPNQVTITSDDQDTVLSLLGGRFQREEALQDDFNQFAEMIALTLDEFQTNETYQYMIDGYSGIAAEVSGYYGESEIVGRIVVVAPGEDQLFYALAFSPRLDNGEGWEPEGRQAFEAVIRTVMFFEPFQVEE
jgi:hypothetical protein